MATTKIEWAEKTWNPMTGCTPASEGCANCYAKALAKRLRAMGQKKYFYEFEPIFHPGALGDPDKWKKPALIFVNSMSDLFHKAFFDSEIRGVFDVMERVDRHKYMVLTKRTERMAVFLRREEASRAQTRHPRKNIALGTTAENQGWLIPRLHSLKFAPAEYRFLSLEPLLGPICLADADPEWHKFIDLVIVGGESGPKARPVHPDWVRSIREQCAGAGVPFCFKQWGEWAPIEFALPGNYPSSRWVKVRADGLEPSTMIRVGKKAAGRLLDGVTHDGAIEWRA